LNIQTYHYLCIIVFQQKIQQVDFYPIPTCNLDELIGTKAAFDIRTAELFSGNIRLDLSTNAIIGVGAFKTAQLAQLTLSPLRCSGIGSSANHNIVLKRPYVDDNYVKPSQPPFTRYVLKDESNLLYREANVLYWAKALLKMTYEFIDCAVEDADAPPPFEVPRLRFVDAGLMLAYSVVTVVDADGTGQPAKPSGTVSMMYLAEEFIPISSGEDFVKYIHNGDAIPCDLFDPKADEIAEFLAFTQHVQYIKTSGQVYISDYQGTSYQPFEYPAVLITSTCRQWVAFDRPANPHPSVGHFRLLLCLTRTHIWVIQ